MDPKKELRGSEDPRQNDSDGPQDCGLSEEGQARVTDLAQRCADLCGRADRLCREGAHEQAADTYGQAVVVAQETGDALTVGDCLVRQGLAFMAAGKDADAVEPLKRGVAVLEEHSGARAPGLRFAWDMLTTAHLRCRDLDEAQSAAARLLAVARANNGETFPLFTDALRRLAFVVACRGDFDEAQALIAQATEIVGESCGQDEEPYAALLGEAATLHIASGAAAAEPLLTRMHGILDRLGLADHPDHQAPMKCFEWVRGLLESGVRESA